ncbi:hypothetical protein ACTFIT_003568 [Dictyostelium discoideum]
MLFNKSNSTKILTNKTIIDRPINYNESSIFYIALGVQCLGYNVHGAPYGTPHGRSVIKICYSLFPNHNWVPWLFKQNIDLSNKRKQADYDYHDEINWCAPIENITDSNLDQWYNISLELTIEVVYETLIGCSNPLPNDSSTKFLGGQFPSNA